MKSPSATALPKSEESGSISTVSQSDVTFHGKVDGLYLTSAADTLWKIKGFVEYGIKVGGQPLTAILESKETDLRRFKQMWKQFQEQFCRRHRVLGIGAVERGCEGESVGMCHAHLLVMFPASYGEKKVFGEVNDDWRRNWARLHLRATGTTISDKRMAFQKPQDGVGWYYGRYAGKAFNRGPMPAKWGREGNQSYLLTVGTRGLGLWDRDELPSRTMSTATAARWVVDFCSPQAEASPVRA